MKKFINTWAVSMILLVIFTVAAYFFYSDGETITKTERAGFIITFGFCTLLITAFTAMAADESKNK